MFPPRCLSTNPPPVGAATGGAADGPAYFSMLCSAVVARAAHNGSVAGSIPAGATMPRVAQPVSAPALGARGRRFKSCHADQYPDLTGQNTSRVAQLDPRLGSAVEMFQRLPRKRVTASKPPRTGR